MYPFPTPQTPIPYQPLSQESSTSPSHSPISKLTYILAILNILLLTALLTIAYSHNPANTILPYSPIRQAVKPVLRKFKPEPIFSRDADDEVDAAWKGLLKADLMVLVDEEVMGWLDHESVEAPWNPGNYMYGVSMFHQLHCLDIIRQSFWPERYFPNKTQTEIHHHKAHCFDFLRQSIQCSGDITMVYWWNRNFTSPITNTYTEYYKNLSLLERSEASFVTWDVVHECRDFGSIEEWVWKAGHDELEKAMRWKSEHPELFE